jgi:hypothetical protein
VLSAQCDRAACVDGGVRDEFAREKYCVTNELDVADVVDQSEEAAPCSLSSRPGSGVVVQHVYCQLIKRVKPGLNPMPFS